ncbi:M48 family metalloprotease [Leptolyngbyaceae cyanobacterium UHCC 1019]
MKNSCSLLLSRTLPLSAVLLFFAPTISSAQTQSTPTDTTTPTTTSSPIATPVTPVAPAVSVTPAQPVNQPTPATVSNPTAIAAPVQSAIAPTPVPVYLPMGSPQYAYPVAAPQYGYPSNVQYGYPSNAPVYGAPSAPVYSAPQNAPGGFSVQVTTQIGIPSQGYPNQGYPNQGYPNQGYPVGVPIQGAPVQGYPVMQPGGYGVPVYSPGYPTVGYPQTGYPQTLPWTQPSTGFSNNADGLPPAAQAFWQQISTSQTLDSQTLSLLQQLVKSYPQFIPGHLRLAQTLEASNRRQDAIYTLQQALSQNPNQPDLVRSLVATYGKANRWTEANSIARQFALKNPNSSLTTELAGLIGNNLQQTPGISQNQSRNGLLGNVVTAGLGYLLTGKVSPPVNSVQTPAWTSNNQSEAAIGAQMARELLGKVELVNDTEVTSYINEIGRKLAQASNRSDLPYEFYVVKDRDAGALALPGGKVFISAGAIANANSEASLANILARQIGHASLSHPMKLVNRTNSTNTITRLLPTLGSLVAPKLGFNNGLVGNVVSGLLSNVISKAVQPNYTAQMNRQAQEVGARLVTTAGYTQGSLINVSSGDRYAQVRAKAQQLIGSNSGSSWWSLGR